VKLHNWPAAHGRINTHCMHGGHSIYGYNGKPLSLSYALWLRQLLTVILQVSNNQHFFC